VVWLSALKERKDGAKETGSQLLGWEIDFEAFLKKRLLEIAVSLEML
jgi:hypothetical protein